MATKQNILRGTMILSIGVMLSKIIGLVYRIPLTNIIGDEGNGLYTSAYQVYVIVLTLTATAIPAGLSKLIAEREALGKHREAEHIFKLTMKASFAIAFVLACAVILGADWISKVCFPNENIGAPIRALAPTILIMTIVASLRGYFQGLDDMMPTALSQVIEQIVHVIFTVVLAYYLIKKSVLSAVTGATFGTSLGAVVALAGLLVIYIRTRKERKPILEKEQDFKRENDKVILKEIFYIMCPIIISTCVFSIMTFVDLSMMSTLLPKSLIALKNQGLLHTVPVSGAEYLDMTLIIKSLKGQYGVQYSTFINIPISLILQIAAVAIPAIAMSLAVNRYDEANQRMTLIFKLGMIIAAPVTIAFLIYARPIVELVFKKGTGSELLAAGAIGLIFITLAQLSAAIMQAMGKPFRASIHAIIACVIKVILNYVLIRIPNIHIFGVIYSTTLCYLIYGGLNLIYLHKAFSIKLEWKDVFIKPIICAGMMGLGSYAIFIGMNQCVASEKLSMLVVIPAAIVIYLIVAVLTHTITKEEIKDLKGGKNEGLVEQEMKASRI